MPFDLNLDQAEVQTIIQKMCFTCQIAMQVMGKDRYGRESFQCPQCHVIYHEDLY